ncbi:MAG: ATP-binding cassette domain-containing protein [Candidatus Polarisedimenticolia bacterium]
MIEVVHLTKTFGGRPAVRDVSFQVKQGEILGFLGPNGAGKTTTMRILTCFMPATSGTARVGGFDVFEQSMEVRRRIGYLPENPPLYNEMTVRSYLDFVGRIKGVASRQMKARIDAVSSQCGLKDVLGRVIGHLSKGYRQRVGLAQALINDPPVLILDEPTAGLDPAQIVEIRQVIKGLAGEHTIVFSTHILPEVTATCSSVVIINYGQAVVAGPLSELAAGRGNTIALRLQVARDDERIAGDLGAQPGVLSVSREAGRPGAYALKLDGGGDQRERIAAHVVQRGWGLTEMTPLTPSLEDIYLSLTGGADKEQAA